MDKQTLDAKYDEWQAARLAYIANPDQAERERLEAAQDAATAAQREFDAQQRGQR